ncbi:MAG: oligopeptide transporter permease, partial [Gammaproteobacteria bacterium]
MLTFTLKRLLSAIPTLFLVVAATFFLIRIAPGGPFDSERNLPPDIRANIERSYHLDEPLLQQFS